MSVPNCPFCPANGKVAIRFENDGAYLVNAMQNNQVIPGAFLIIPKKHTTSENQLPTNWWLYLTSLREEIREELGEHYNISLNVGSVAGQRISHLHWWVIRRDDAPQDKSFELGLNGLRQKLNAQAYRFSLSSLFKKLMRRH